MSDIGKTDELCRLDDDKAAAGIQKLIDAMPFYVILVDEDHCIALANQATAGVLGRDVREIIGGYCPKIVHGLDHPFEGCPLEEVVAGGRAISKELQNAKTQAWMESVIYPTSLKTVAGKRVYYHTVRDITEEKRAQEAERTSGAKYESIFNSASEGIFQTSVSGQIVTVNPAAAEMLGFATPAELIDSFPNIGEMYIHPAEKEELSQLLQRQDVLVAYEVRMRRRDGETIWVSLSFHRTRDASGAITGLEGMAVDVTAKKNAEAGLRESLSRLEESFSGLIGALARTVERRDPYTAGHQRRVATLAGAIAGKLGLPEEQLRAIDMAATVHDIGKIYVPAEILNKPGKLTETEFDLIKAHSQAGFEILRDIRFDQPIAAIVHQHHERLDGSGYPQGLVGKDMELGAKIIAVADVVEAITAHRPYRPGLGIDVALDEIRQNRGRLYDAAAVDTCLALFEAGEFVFDYS